jgi:hypothetical protein
MKTFESMKLLRSSLKLARCPHLLAATLAALPSMSLIPVAPFFLLILFALSPTAQTPPPDQASAIAAIVQKAMKTEHLRAVIVKVTQGDKAGCGNWVRSKHLTFHPR